MNRPLVLIIAMIASIVLAILIGRLLTVNIVIPIAIVLGLFVGFLTFQNPENGLIVIIFSMLLSPEIPIGTLAGPNNMASRAIGIRVDDVLIIVVFLAWLAHTAIDKNWKGFVRTPFNNILLFMTTLYIVSTAIGIINGNVNLARGILFGLKYIEYLIIYWLVVNVSSKASLPKYLYAGLITFIIVMIHSYSLFGSVNRVYAPFDSQAGGEPATLGGYYLIIYAILFSLILHAKSTPVRVAIISLILISMPTFMKTLSRASFLGFVPMVLSMLLLTRKRKILFGLILLTGVLLMPILFQSYYTELIDRVKYTFTGAHMQGYQTLKLAGAKIEDQSALERVLSWERTVNVYFLKNARTMLIGNGITGIRFTEGQFFLLLGELGLLGVITFYWMQIKIMLSSYKLYLTSDEPITQSLALGMIAVFVGLTFQSLTTNTFIIVRIMEPFWFLVAIVAFLIEQNKDARAQQQTVIKTV